MKQFLQKLKSKAGESLVESLAAILIFTMASIVMFSMVSAAGDINGKAKEMDRINQEQLVAVEKGVTSYVDEAGNTVQVANGTADVTMSLPQSGGTSIQIAAVEVDIYGGQDGSLFTYFVQTPTEPEGG